VETVHLCSLRARLSVPERRDAMRPAGRQQRKDTGDHEPDGGGPPPSELGSFAHPVSDVFVLAATERAERHRTRDGSGVVPSDVFAHMGFAYNPAASRQFRPYLEALMAAGLLGTASRKKVRLWVLTSVGRRALANAQGKGEGAVLPESPQHRKWRHSRETASELIDSYRSDVRALLEEAVTLLDSGSRAHSDSWFCLANRFPDATRHLGAAVYCLAEPVDVRADVDDHTDPNDDKLEPDERARRRHLRHGRRNVIHGQIV
jgi:hypothetical protein